MTKGHMVQSEKCHLGQGLFIMAHVKFNLLHSAYSLDPHLYKRMSRPHAFLYTLLGR